MTMSTVEWSMVVLVSVLSACGGSSNAPLATQTVGASCSSDSQCTSKCIGADEVSGGMCTVSCRSDLDCPAGTACIGDKDGICAIVCQTAVDCSGSPTFNVCGSKDRLGADAGQVLVCRKP
jgi:hypothetical protein